MHKDFLSKQAPFYFYFIHFKIKRKISIVEQDNITQNYEQNNEVNSDRSQIISYYKLFIINYNSLIMMDVNQQSKQSSQNQVKNIQSHSQFKNSLNLNISSITKSESLSPASVKFYPTPQEVKSSSSPNILIKKHKYDKLVKLYQANRLRLEKFKEKERILQLKKIEQMEIKCQIQKIIKKDQKSQKSNIIEEQLSLFRKLKQKQEKNAQEFQAEENQIKKLQLQLLQSQSKIKKPIMQTQNLSNFANQQQFISKNVRHEELIRQNQRLRLQVTQSKEGLQYLQDKIWLQEEKCKQFYTQEMLSQEVFNIQYKMQVMKITNQATNNYFSEIKSEIQLLQNAKFTEIQTQINSLTTQCQDLMDKKNNILPQAKIYKEKRKRFKQAIQVQKQKMAQQIIKLKDLKQKLDAQNINYRIILTNLIQYQDKIQKEKGEPQELQNLRWQNNELQQQIKISQTMYQKLKGTIQNLVPKAMANDYQKKIKHQNKLNQKLSKFLKQNQSLSIQNIKLSKLKDQIQWKNNPHYKIIETQSQKLSYQNQHLQKQTKQMKKSVNFLQLKLVLLEQKQKQEEQKRQQEKDKEEELNRYRELKQKQAQSALKRLIQRLDRQKQDQIVSINPSTSTSQKILNVNHIAAVSMTGKKTTKSKRNTPTKQRRSNQSNFSHSLKLQESSSSTQSSLKNNHQIEFIEHVAVFEPQEEQLSSFIKKYPTCTYIIFLIIFFFIPGGFLMKFG